MACPLCAKMLEDAVKAESLDGQIQVKDLAEILPGRHGLGGLETMAERLEQIRGALEAIVGPDHVSGEAPDMIPYIKDSYSTMMGREVPLPDFVVMPKTAEEVQQIVKLANQHLFPIYPRSFGVNIAGSALPYNPAGWC